MYKQRFPRPPTPTPTLAGTDRTVVDWGMKSYEAMRHYKPLCSP